MITAHVRVRLLLRPLDRGRARSQVLLRRGLASPAAVLRCARCKGTLRTSIAASAVIAPRPPLPQSALDRDSPPRLPVPHSALDRVSLRFPPFLTFRVSFPRPRAGRMSAQIRDGTRARRRENRAEPRSRGRARYIPRQGEAARKFPRTGEWRPRAVAWRRARSAAPSRSGSPAPRPALSRLAGAGGGTTVPGKLLWKLDPGAVDRLAARLPQGSALDLGDERQDDDRGDGRARSSSRRCGSPTTAPARTSSPAWPPRSLAARDAELGLFEVDEAALPEVAARLRSARGLAREPVPRPARPLRRARARGGALARRWSRDAAGQGARSS